LILDVAFSEEDGPEGFFLLLEQYPIPKLSSGFCNIIAFSP